jgi:hypothetical protein
MIPRYLIFWAFLLFTCGYALWRGRKFEQLSALVFIAASVASLLSHAPARERYMGIEISDLVIDLIVLAALIAIALKSDRFWPLWVAGLQLTVSVSHLMKAIQPDLMPFAYAAAERFWSYPILLILFAGAWRQHRRRREHLDPAAT